MVNQVIKLTGSSNHNKCAKADVKDPKAWCYTTDSNKRWEHCSPLCTGPDDPNNSDDPDNSDDSVVGTRFRDIPEQVPHMDPRSKYDQNGNCIKNCRSRSHFGIQQEIQQCGRNECQKPKPHLVQIYNWSQPSLESLQQCDCGKSSTKSSKDEVFGDFKSKYVIFIILIHNF